ncbi:hypothetical protein H7J08_15165 [Mycobacterium frederiksbergense]|uniref:hypothetical protein n=1 Tax=Mycolicibacterium frederiksbergense TaxID=117567 RepID=UPI0021F3AF90|nr:hypothetical protein [Mycolicibacterium frederiksbergense]MCV7045997.1 hypothetical protein [Mycolicibacterium frederiksbergense]
MERLLGVAQRAVEIAAATQPRSVLTADWQSARDAAYAAIAQYLAIAAAEPAPATLSHPPINEVALSIDAARAGLATFNRTHHQALTAATAAATAASAEIESAQADAANAFARLASLSAEIATYPSVQAARTQLEAAQHSTRSALGGANVADMREAAHRLRTSAAALDEAVTAGPGRIEHARRSVASVQTRLEAAAHRADSIAENFSALLREFHANSSADLRDNEQRSRAHIATARAHLRLAARALAERQPEPAATDVNKAREALGYAEALINAIPARLGTLRALRSDPASQEREVRFRIRDAQRLAVDRDAVAEWGTVLDAQVKRVDHIVAALDGHPPDYWKYHTALNEVTQFVTNVVDRIRHQAASR